LAWILATHRDLALRNGARAVVLAERACQATDYKRPAYLQTLAAAYAEAGRFAEALDAAERAQNLLAAASPEEARNKEMLERFRAGRPYREQPEVK
jgi:hypothetical protein